MTSLRGNDTFAIGGTISVSRLGFGLCGLPGLGSGATRLIGRPRSGRSAGR